MAVREPLDFGTLLRQYRAAAGLTQEELAERANMSARGISDLERGVKRVPYRDTVRRLADALQLPPSDRRLFESIARGHRSPPISEHARHAPRRTPRGVFVGRGTELGRIEQCLEDEGAHALFLSGEPGIGKSRLLQEAMLRYSDRHLAVLRGGCHRGSEHEPYAPIVDALAEYVRQQSPRRLEQLLRESSWLVRLLPELLETVSVPMPLGSLPPEQERRLLFSSAVRFLAAARGASPAVLVLDDLHWAGADALELLNVIVGSGEVRVLAAFRDTDVGPTHPLSVLLADLAHAQLAEELPLRPLPADDAGTLLDALLETPIPEHLREQLLARCGGVPFYVTSCAREAHVDSESTAVVPWSVDQSVRLRVAVLDPPTQDVLKAASVVGSSASSDLLARVTGAGSDVTAAALDAACRARLMPSMDRRFMFTHDLVRDVIYADIGHAGRGALHQRVLDALVQLPEPEQGRRAAELARHAQLGGDLPRTARYALTAGDQAAGIYAHAEAEYFYRLTADAARALSDHETMAEAEYRLGRVLVSMSRLSEAVEVLGEAARIYRTQGDAGGEAKAIAALSTADFYSGTEQRETDGLRRLVSDLETREPSEALCSLYIALTHPLWGPNPESVRVAERASAMARLLGNDNLLAEAEVRRGLAYGGVGDWRTSTEILVQTIPLAEAVADPQHLSRALCFAGLAHLIQGKPDEAWSLTSRAVEPVERELELEREGADGAIASAASTVRLPVLGMFAYALNQAGRAAFARGHWSDARRCYERAVEIGRQSPMSFLGEYVRDLAELEITEGRWDDAARSLDELRALQSEGRLEVPDRTLVCLLATRELLHDNLEGALESIRPVLDRFYEGQECYLLIPPVAEEVCVEVGDLEAASRLAGEHGALLKQQGNALNTPPWLRAKGMLAARQGSPSEAEALFHQAIALSAAMPRPLERARALRELGMLLAVTDRAAGEARLSEALNIFRELGARPDAVRTERVLNTLPA